MKIAVWHNLRSGGGKRALYYHVKGLHELGHELRVWCPPSADLTYMPLNGFAPEIVVPLDIQKTRMKWPIHWSSNWFNAKNSVQALELHCTQCAKEMKDWGADVLFAGSCVLTGTSPIARFSDIPSIIYMGEPKRSLYEARENNPWALKSAEELPPGSKMGLGYFCYDLATCYANRLKVREEVKSALAFDRLLVNSLYSRESTLRAYGLDSRVCYLGIDCDLFKPTSAPKENYVVGLGSFTFGKGINRAIDILGAVDQNLRPKLVWIGNIGDPDALKNFADYALKAGVHFEARLSISDPELIECIGKASLMLYTSWLEPFGLAPLEANACGTTVVAIAEGGVRESIVHGTNGYLIHSNNPAQGATYVQKLVTDPDLAASMGKLARQHVQNTWNWSIAVGNLEQNLTQVLGKR